MPSQCVCSTTNAFQSDPYHAFTCPTLRSHGSIFRHNLLLNSIATWTKRAGILTEIEVSQLSSDGRLRPDIVLSNGSEMRIVDVTVVHSLSKTNLRKSTCNTTSTSSSRFGHTEREQEQEQQEEVMVDWFKSVVG